MRLCSSWLQIQAVKNDSALKPACYIMEWMAPWTSFDGAAIQPSPHPLSLSQNIDFVRPIAQKSRQNVRWFISPSERRLEPESCGATRLSATTWLKFQYKWCTDTWKVASLWHGPEVGPIKSYYELWGRRVIIHNVINLPALFMMLVMDFWDSDLRPLSTPVCFTTWEFSFSGAVVDEHVSDIGFSVSAGPGINH